MLEVKEPTGAYLLLGRGTNTPSVDDSLTGDYSIELQMRVAADHDIGLHTFE